MLNFIHKWFYKKHCIVNKHLKKDAWYLSEDDKKEITNFYWKVSEMLLLRVSSIQYGSIGTFWKTKTWCSSKIFMNFINFSCLIFWAENVLISPDQNVSRYLQGKLFRFFLWIEYILGILEQFGTESYTWRLDIVQKSL